MGKFTSKETLDSILWDSQSMDIDKLHGKYGIQKGTIRSILYRHNIKPQKPDPTRFLIPKEKLEAILANGWMSVHDMAAACDCSYPTISKSLKHHGLLRGRKPTVRHRMKEGNRAFKVLGYIMANPDMPHEVVGQQFNCSRELVGQIEAMARKEGIIK